MKLLCVGDSLTFGNVGYSYIPFLDKNFIAINKGVNGETLDGATGRLKHLFLKGYEDYDLIILGIGTNDILLPYLKNIDPYWKLQMSFRCRIKNCMEDDSLFLNNFEMAIEMIRSKGKRAVVFGIPHINLTDFPNEKSLKRNQEMKSICKKYGFYFIDIFNLQMEKLPQEKRVYSWKWSFLIRIIDAVIMTIFPKSKDTFAGIRRLKQTVDGVHFNSNSANLLANEIESIVEKS